MSQPGDATSTKTSGGLASLSFGRKILLLLGNALPFLQCAGIASLVWILWPRPSWCAGAILVWLYLMPPLLCRVLLLILPIRRQVIPIGSREFFVWWFTLNLQMVFSRLPFLEELLRLVPGLYSAWLRLWGARIGKLTYWAAGVRILDRPFLAIGDLVTFGAGVRLNPHVILPDETGQQVLMLAPVTIAERVNIGAYSLLVAGTVIGSDQATRACLMLPPFNRLEQGRRIRPAGPSQTHQREGTWP